MKLWTLYLILASSVSLHGSGSSKHHAKQENIEFNENVMKFLVAFRDNQSTFIDDKELEAKYDFKPLAPPMTPTIKQRKSLKLND